MRRLLLACLIFACACCASSPQRVYIHNAQPLHPEAWYETIYQDVEKCAAILNRTSGIRYRDIEWFMLPAGAIPGVAGLWSQPNRIYLDAAYVLDYNVIKHESGHAAIAAGHNNHADSVFKLCTRAD